MWYLEGCFRFFLCSRWQGVDLRQINLASGFFSVDGSSFKLIISIWSDKAGIIFAACCFIQRSRYLSSTEETAAPLEYERTLLFPS